MRIKTRQLLPLILSYERNPLMINFFQKLQWRITKSYKEWHIKLRIKKCKVDSPSTAALDENLWIVTQEDIWSFCT